MPPGKPVRTHHISPRVVLTIISGVEQHGRLYELSATEELAGVVFGPATGFEVQLTREEAATIVAALQADLQRHPPKA